MIDIIKVNKTRFSCFVTSLLLQTVFFALTIIFGVIQFGTNDDMTLMYTAAGYLSRDPEPHMIMNSIIAGFVESSMYKILPAIPWHTIISLGIIFFSGTVIFYAILKASRQSGKGALIGSILCLLYFIIFELSIILALQFTTTAVFAGSAAVAAMMVLNPEKKLDRAVNIVIIPLLLFISYNWRPMFFVIPLCFFLLVAVIRFWAEFHKIWRISSLVVCFSILLISFSYIADTYSKSVGGWHEYFQYNNIIWRAKDLGLPDYKTNSAMYNSMGWDENLYTLVACWYFIDDRVNPETLKNIADYRDAAKASQLANETRGLVVKRIGAYSLPILYDGLCFRILTALMIIVGICLGRRLIGKSGSPNNYGYWPDILLILGALLGLAGFWTAFCYLGRFLPRVFISMGLACSGILFIELAAAQPLIKSKLRDYTGIVLAVILTTGTWATPIIALEKTNELTIESNQIKKEIDQYCLQNRNNFYIYDYSISKYVCSPFTAYPDLKPTNLIFWGGTYVDSPSYNKQLKINGLKGLSDRDLLKDNVYLLSDQPYDFFVDYLHDKYPQYTLTKVEDVAGAVSSYKLKKSNIGI